MRGCDCVICMVLTLDRQNLSGMWSRGGVVAPYYFVPAIKTFRRCLA